jgi:hypothetical protein
MLQFTIRDLLWLTVVVALGVLWGGEVRQRKIDGAELWAKNQQISVELTHSINLLAAEYQERFHCDAATAVERAERRVTALTRKQHIR